MSRIRDIKIGDTILVDGTARISDIIEDVQGIRQKKGSNYTHAMIVIEIDNKGNIWVSEAIENGICRTNLHEYLSKNVSLLVCNPLFHDFTDDSELLIKLSTKYINHSKYWYKGLINQLLRFLLGNKNYINPKSGEFICSMWCWYCYFMLSDDMRFANYSSISPLDIYNSEYFTKSELVYYQSEIDWRYNRIK
jgi:hypothetical protein